jgi:uncharacterized protein
MRKILLLLLIPFNAAFCQQNDHKLASEKIIHQLNNREFSKVTDQFDSLAAKRLNEGRLTQVWDNLIKLAGPFVKILDTVDVFQQNENVIVRQCQFEKKKINFKITFSSNQKIAGLAFLPGESRDSYTMPLYSKQELFSERPMHIQNGPFKLTGVLAAPKSAGRHPVVILIHGSGPNDRDETVGSTKIFRDLANGLATKGIAVYRYEKRTRSYPRMLKDKRLLVRDEVIADAIAAAKMLKADSSIDSTQIYYCGHSMGGALLPQIAKEVKGVKGLIYLAPNARPLEDIFADQLVYITNLDSTISDKKTVIDSIHRDQNRIKSLTGTETDSTFIFQHPVGYWNDLKNYNQVKSALALSMPMFFLQGGRDYQVPESDFNQWKAGFVAKKNAKFKLYPDLNHFFIKGKGKSTPAEYNKAGNVDVTVINDIASWILPGKK